MNDLIKEMEEAEEQIKLLYPEWFENSKYMIMMIKLEHIYKLIMEVNDG